MSMIPVARRALNIDPARLARVAARHGVEAQGAVERFAYRRAVLDRGGVAAARMAAVILGRAES